MASILEEVQAHCAERLNADPELSGSCSFVSENRRDLEYEIKNRLGRQGLVGVVMTPKAVYAGKYEDLFLAWQLDELEVDVIENVPVNRGKKGGFMTGQEAAMRAFQVLCPLSGEYEGQFSPVSYEEGEDGGLVVNKCVFKALVCGEREPAPPPEKPVGMKFMKLLDEPPAGVQPRDGWAWLSGDQFFCCAGEEVLPLGVAPSWMSSYVQQGLSAKADLSSLGLYLPLSGGYLLGPVYAQGTVETPQVNVRNEGRDESITIRHDQLSSLQMFDSFDTDFEHPATLPFRRDGTVAYVSDVEQAVSSKAEASALEAVAGSLTAYALKEDVPLSVSQLANDANYIDRQALNQALSAKASKAGDTMQWVGIGRPEQRIQSGVQLGFQFSIDDFGSALVKPKAETDVNLDFPGRDGTLATLDDVQEAVSAKADVSALAEKADLSALEQKADLSALDAKADLSALDLKADLSALDLKQDRLSDGQMSALGDALLSLSTKAKYQDGTVSSFLFIGDTPEIFPNRENVTEVELGLGVSAVGTFTFNGATRLKSVKCDEGMVEIKGGSFNGCTGLSSIKFPSTLTAITGTGGTFGRCTSLYDVDFPEGLKFISQYCFLDTPISSAVFRGKTAAQVSAMTWYPWAIQRDAVRTWNAASQEWVLQQLSALQPGA